MSIHNLENGWLGNENERGTATAKVRVGICDECDEAIYEEDELYTHVYCADGKLRCWNCYEAVMDHFDLNGDYR